MSHLGSKDFRPHLEVLQEQRDRIQKGLYGDDDIQKGGEGSRGGKVIGHTKSGKAIYNKYDHPSHKNFTKQDHKDASDQHDKEAERHRVPALGKGRSANEAQEKMEYHHEESDKHDLQFHDMKDSKHISDMSKEEKHIAAEKLGIKGHKDMSEKDLDKELTDKNVEKQVKEFKDKKDPKIGSEIKVAGDRGSGEYKVKVLSEYKGDDLLEDEKAYVVQYTEGKHKGKKSHIIEGRNGWEIDAFIDTEE